MTTTNTTNTTRRLPEPAWGLAAEDWITGMFTPEDNPDETFHIWRDLAVFDGNNDPLGLDGYRVFRAPDFYAPARRASKQIQAALAGYVAGWTDAKNKMKSAIDSKL